MSLTKQDPPVSPARLDRPQSAAEAYKKVEPEILALATDAIGRVTADVPQASSIALGAIVNLEQLRPDYARLGDGGKTVKYLDALGDYALAALYAHLQSIPDSSQNQVMALIEQARPIRENLLKMAVALASFGIFDSRTVDAISQGTGHIDTAEDLVALGTLFSSNWELVSGKVPFGPELPEQAALLGPQLLRAVGFREVGEVRKDPSYDWESLRARSFRLLVNAYEELRRATQYVRWYKDDAKAFTPSLHARSAPRTKPAASEEKPAESQPITSDQAALGAQAYAVDPGLPGASPFVAKS